MKKILFFAASAVVALASCTQSDEVFVGPDVSEQALAENAVSFATYMGSANQTRAGWEGSMTTATLKDNDKSKGFGVFAFYTGSKGYGDYKRWKGGSVDNVEPNFMYNQRVYWNESATSGYITHWYYTPLKYWPNEVKDNATDTTPLTENVDDQDNDKGNEPATTDYTHGGNVSFFAYAPYVDDAALSANHGDGIIAINGATTVAEGNSKAQDPVITYVVAADGQVVDLLWGTLGTAHAGVSGAANTGVTGSSTVDYTEGTITSGVSNKTYAEELLAPYATPADISKQKTNGTVELVFKHALSKVGGFSETPDPSDPSSIKHGLLVQLDIDDQKGAETGGAKPDATKVHIRSVKIVAKSKVADDSGKKPGETGYADSYLKKLQGDLNLATGKWDVLRTSNIATGSTVGDAGATTHIIAKEGTTDADAVLADDLLYTTKTISTESDFTSLVKGVLTTPKNVYKSETNPLVFIPGTWPELTITVDYDVRTYDEKLDGKHTDIEQVISKKVTFAEPVKLNKMYSLIMHLGLTSVKFEAKVDNWEVDNDDPNYDSDGDGTVDLEVTDAYLPINVATAAAAVNSAKSFDYNSTGHAYTYQGTSVTEGNTITYTISATEAVTNVSTTDHTKKSVADLSRLLGALYRIDNGVTVNSITYNSKVYEWNIKPHENWGSNWAEKGATEKTTGNTLVSAIATAIGTPAANATHNVTLTINGKTDEDNTINLVIKFT
ncbi:MAG: hypothetical protein IJQ76_08300 [Prevotella sp.]|nr:hypothetical protein [Prevotella sp.]